MPRESDHDIINDLVQSFEEFDELAPPVMLDEIADWPGQSGEPATNAPQDEVSRRYLVVLAAACLAVVGLGGAWFVTNRDTSPSSLTPADEPAVSSDAPPASSMSTSTTAASAPGATSVPNSSDTLTADSPIVERVESLDPWSAAQLFQPDAVYRASPAQAADLTIANELESRACYEEQGVDIAEFDPGRLAEWEQYEQTRWNNRRLLWTPDGQQRLRQEGNLFFRRAFENEPMIDPHSTTPAPEQCYPAATGVTFLGGPVVWSEDQLQMTLENGDRAWSPVSWSFGRMPGTEDAKNAVDDCMVGRGWDQWREPAGYQYLYAEPEVSETEITLMNDLVDCYQQANATDVYLTVASEYVDAFRAEFADQLEQIESDRADALAEAYEVLHAAGLDPLSDDD